jgi:hypothetical protein
MTAPPPGAWQTLPAEVTHRYSGNSLTLVAVFSRAPLGVRDIERAVAAGGARLPLPDTAQSVTRLRVE